MHKDSLLIKIKRIIYILINELPLFGLKVSMAKISIVLHNGSTKSTIKKNQRILDYLKNNNQNLIEKYKNTNTAYDHYLNSCDTIWIFWWQGLENMPEIIKACYNRTVHMVGTRKVILIDQKNIKEYIDFPDYVWEQFNNGKLKIQHFADILRIRLLKQYGGLWLDASIYCLKPIPEEVFRREFFSLRSNPDTKFISDGRWTTFLIGGRKSYILFNFLDEFFMEYCKTGKPFLDYFMFDTAIALAYSELPEVRKEIDNLSVSEKGFYWLTEHLEDNYQNVADEISKQSDFQKIGWKGTLNKEYSYESVYQKIVLNI